ncbi:hypothetical protein [Undibacterium sp. TS12]|uniref:hypothetical protein n=1 Tax=Undibacterium sp. TS12 TaxID=2908202 RepID=UPI001F4CD113|nr:hypothetical protein [Undibacterium sp. TS12]MCH8618002.1 hypothetical protein [Undibacterium sp. TS12]
MSESVNYTFTTFFNQGDPQSRGTISATGKFNPEPPRDPVSHKHVLNVGDTVLFNFQGTPTYPSNTFTVTASAFIAICKGILSNGQSATIGTTKTACPVDGVTMTMTEDSLGFWGFTISFTADFTDPSGNVVSSEFFYLPDPEVDVQTGG